MTCRIAAMKFGTGSSLLSDLEHMRGIVTAQN